MALWYQGKVLNMKKKNVIIVAVALCIPYVTPALATNGEKEISVEATLGIGDADGGVEWSYVLEGRPDPFRSFVKEIKPQAVVEDSEIEVKPEELTGMRRFEPGQLTLVAIMFSSGKNVAMVEDDTGRGYPIYQNMPIGRYGVIEAIEDNEVKILETIPMRSGEQKVSTYVMRLKSEVE